MAGTASGKVTDPQAVVGNGGIPVKGRGWIVAALMLVMVLASLEATITATAMPTIIGDLHGLEHYSWVASIYLLASTVVMPLYGRLSDVWGRKRVIVFAIALFATGSLLAACSQNMGQLIVFRGIQGLGAGGIMPVVLTILGDIFTLEERGKIQGVFSAVWGTAALAGPMLGFLLIRTLGWPSIFWVNLPAGLLGVLILLTKYHETEKGHSTELDLPGVVTLGLGASALLAGVSFLGGMTVQPWVPVSLLALAAGLIGVFVGIERKSKNPIMPPRLMLQRAIGPAMVISGLIGVGVFSLETFVPLFVQGGRGGSAAATAATVTPVMLAWASSSYFAAPLLVKWGFRKLAIVGAGLILSGFLGLLACVYFQAPLLLIMLTLFMTGAGFGPASMSCLLSAQAAVAWQQRGMVTSSITFYRNFGGALGVGLLGALFNMQAARRLAELAQGKFAVSDLLSHHKLAELQKTHPDILKSAQGEIVGGLWWVFVMMVALAALQVMVALFISKAHAKKPADAGDALVAVE